MIFKNKLSSFFLHWKWVDGPQAKPDSRRMQSMLTITLFSPSETAPYFKLPRSLRLVDIVALDIKLGKLNSSKTRSDVQQRTSRGRGLWIHLLLDPQNSWSFWSQLLTVFWSINWKKKTLIFSVTDCACVLWDCFFTSASNVFLEGIFNQNVLFL